MFKVGMGQDSHKFSRNNDKPLILGGVKFSEKNGLEANSDGDIIIHALCNALRSAIGKGSLSIYSDEMCKKGIISSIEYLKVALKQIDEAEYKINNISINIEAKKPKIEPLSQKIKNKLAKLMGISKNNIGITATSGENLTSFGRGEGIQTFVIVSLIQKTDEIKS